MADLSNTKDITTVDSTPSVAITDKIYINKGGKLQQVSLATAIESKIDSSLSKSKFAADAKATKDAISKVDSDIKAQNPISETIFSNTVTSSPTAYGNAIPEQIEGDIGQDTTKGLQLFDANRISDYSAGGVTLRNNKDGSFTISGSGELTEVFSISYSLSHEDSVKLFPSGSYQITRGNIYPAIFLQKRVNNVNTSINNKSVDTNYLDVTEEDVANESYIMQFVFYGTAGSSIVPGTIKPMAWASAEVPQDADWGPYTGGQPSPNPDYPQIVHGVGDMGFFDGELVQGAYKIADGSFGYGDRRYISNANKIPCHQGDMVTLQYDGDCNGAYIHFYKQDNSFIQSKNVVGNKVSFVAPTGTGYCNITIYKADSIFVASAKHITVTINDKYAVCVKSKGKNLLNLTGEILYSFGRETIFDNQVTIRPTTDGRSAPGVWFVLGDIKKFLGKTIYVKADAIQRSGNYNPRMLLMTIKGNTSVRTYLTYSYSKAGQVMSVKIPDDLDTNEASDLALNMYVNDGSSQVDADAYAIFTNVYAGLSEPTNEFVPYQSNVTYIPVDYPLFEGDKIVRRNGEYKLLRKWKQEVFDGSEDEGWVQGKSNTNQFYTSQYKEKKVNADIVSNRFKHATSVEPPSIWIGNDINIYFESGYLDNNTIAGFQEWLQENPVSCVYELATPTEEPLSSEAMKTLYSIMACDEETELTIVGVPSDAEIQNQFLLPRNEDGALNTTAYCTAKRNEIALEELENATAARLSALETQALQEV